MTIMVSKWLLITQIGIMLLTCNKISFKLEQTHTHNSYPFMVFEDSTKDEMHFNNKKGGFTQKLRFKKKFKLKMNLYLTITIQA
jgi:hypothetical protein